MSDPIIGQLQTQATLVDCVESKSTPEWVRAHWRSFRKGLSGERNGAPFPCFFGEEAIENGELLYTAVPSMTEKDALLSLGRTLLEYLDVRENEYARTPLVTFFRPPERRLSETDYHEILWHILQFLHVHDPEPWPEEIPTDPDDPHWEFCFGGEPIFPTCRAPFYETRKSRYCPIGLEITFQPRALFENFGVTADTEFGKQARDVIQDRLETYDGVCPHADLGDWGVEGDREWIQYLLSEDDSKTPSECPINVTREHPKSTLLSAHGMSHG